MALLERLAELAQIGASALDRHPGGVIIAAATGTTRHRPRAENHDRGDRVEVGVGGDLNPDGGAEDRHGYSRRKYSSSTIPRHPAHSP